MYIGKHKGRGKSPSGDEIHIPENYAGNAFSDVKESEETQIPDSEEAHEELPCMLPACKSEHTSEHSGFLPHFDKLFSSDALLILLALLLSRDEDGGELAMILLLLLLF